MEEGDINNPSTPFLYSDHIYTMLNNALDYGLPERDFWEMTFAELDRYVDSRLRVIKVEQKQRASDNYTLAVLVGRALGAMFDKESTFPTLEEVYPKLFYDPKKEEEEQEQRNQLSALRFEQFAKSLNKKFNEEEQKTINE